ncbi:iron ABC transporter permease, partial [Rhizobium ruizarguesonis]
GERERREGRRKRKREGGEEERREGEKRRRGGREISRPLSLPGISAGAAIAFVSCTGNGGIPAILGIPAAIYTWPTVIFTK